MKKFNRRKGMLISMSIISSILCLLYILRTQFSFANALEEFKTANTRENAPKHINIINGDFENPIIDSNWAYIKAMNTYFGDEIYLDAWNIGRIPIEELPHIIEPAEEQNESTATEETLEETTEPTSAAAANALSLNDDLATASELNIYSTPYFYEYLELKRIGENNGVGANQSLELVADTPLYIYQNFEASPKKKIYINFNYRSPRGSADTLKVYLAPNDYEKDEEKLIFSSSADVSWKNETLSYEIPDGQPQNSIGFFSEGSRDSSIGVNIDNVDIKTAAYLVATKSSNKNIADLKDETSIKYNISIKNYGQVPAIISNISDMLDRNITSISDLKLDDVNIDNYAIDNSNLSINLINAFSLEAEESMELSYIAHFDNSNISESLKTTRTQTTISYKDFAYNKFGEETKAYSNIYEQQLYKSKQEPNIEETRDFGESNVDKASRSFTVLGNKVDNEEKLEFKLELENPQNLNIAGSNLRYDINIENKSDKPIKHIWLRAYVPKYTNYFDNDNLGEYGYVNNREHITWYIDEIPANTTKKLYYDVGIDYCIGGAIESETYYEILDKDEKPYYNIKTNPKNRLD